MLQFYFLSILLNVITGLVFIYSSKNEGLKTAGEDFDDPFAVDASASVTEDDSENLIMETSDKKTAAAALLEDKSFCLVLGILMVLVGLLKFLSPIQFDIAIIGDLIPALAGLAGGSSILLEWYEEKTSLELELPEILQSMFIDGRKYLGIFCIAAGILHFIFPRVLFL